MNISFAGKRALVTGAGQGIGRALVKKLVLCDAQVVAVSKTKANLDSLRKEVPTIQTVCVDLADWNATENALKEVGPIDLLVNNAAVAQMKPFGEIKEEDLDSVYAINVKAVVNISQMVVKGMKERGTGGSIVNVSSTASLVGLKDHSVYGASKGALDLLTRVMALELGPHNIRVNCINPTVVNTEMAKVGWSDATKAAAMKSRISMGRFCEPDEVVNAIIFLLSDASPMIHGVNLFIDGGLTSSTVM